MQHISLKSIHIQNFKSLSSFDLYFEPGTLSIIKGPNGAGKTSIFNSVYTCLYNRQMNGRAASKAIKYGESSCFLELNFDVNGTPYTVRRGIGKNSGVEVLKESVSLVKGKNAMKIIEELVPSDIMKLHMLQNLSIRDLISNLVDVTSFVENVRKKKQEYINKISNIEKQKIEIETKIQNNKAFIEKLENYKQNLETIIENLKEKLQGIQNEIQSKKITPDLEERLTKYQTELSMRYKDIQKDINEKYRNEYEVPRREIMSEIQLVDSKIKEILTTLRQKKDAELKPLEKQEIDLNRDIQELNKEISRYQGLLKKMKCFVCDREISQDDLDKYNNKIQEMLNQIENKKNEISSIANQKTEIENKYTEIANHYSERAKNKKIELENKLVELENVKSEINKMRLEVDNVKRKIAQQLMDKYQLTDENLSISLDKINKLTNSKLQIETEIKVKTEALDDTIKQIEDYKKQLEELTNSDKIVNLTKNLEDIERKIEILDTWTDTRLLKRLLVKDISRKFNSLIQNKYSYMMEVKIDLDEKDELVITAINRHGSEVDLNDVSNGESVIARLQIYCALIELISGYVRINALFLDEFLDSLDETNASRALLFLRELARNKNLCVFVITHRQIQETSDNIIDLT